MDLLLWLPSSLQRQHGGPNGSNRDWTVVDPATLTRATHRQHLLGSIDITMTQSRTAPHRYPACRAISCLQRTLCLPTPALSLTDLREPTSSAHSASDVNTTQLCLQRRRDAGGESCRPHPAYTKSVSHVCSMGTNEPTNQPPKAAKTLGVWKSKPNTASKQL